MSGKLFIVATPIGNLDDFSVRGIDTLKNADLILAEDTRVTMKLLIRFNIRTRVESYHKFSEKRQLEKYLAMLSDGKKIALVSDAGTPAVSDPGKYLVKAALEGGITVHPIPGPTAAMAVFSAAGVMSDSFVFAGFLPSKGAERKKKLDYYISLGTPFILYESPARIANLISLLEETGARVVIGREVTKQFEDIFLYTGDSFMEKGEFTVVVEPHEVTVSEDVVDPELVKLLESKNLTRRDISEIVSKVYPELKPNRIKKLLIKKNSSDNL